MGKKSGNEYLYIRLGFVTNNNKLNQETMDIDGDGKLDNGWIKNDENEGALTGLLVDYYVDLAENHIKAVKKYMIEIIQM